MDILDFYRGLLTAAGLEVTETGQVNLKSADTTLPLTISGQQLMLPTKELLSQGLSEQQIAFHPLCEGIARKESVVLKRYRKVIQYRMNWIMAELLTQLMDIAVDTSRHGELSPDQAQFLTMLAQADKKTLDALTKVIGKMDNENVTRRLVSVYLKRPGLVGGKEYPRAAIVTFPMLDCLKDSEPSIFGVKMRQKDKDAIVALFLHILPNATEVGEYSYGTNDLTAPNLHALTMASAGILEKFNNIVALYGNQLEDSAEFATDLTYVGGLEQMAKFRALVPELRGNAGEKLDGRDDEAEEVAAAAPTPKTERARPVIGFPPPDKERPAAPAQAEPIRRTNDQPQVQRPVAQPEQFPAASHRETPQQRENSARKNTWMDTLRQPQQQPAPGYAPPGYHQPPPGYHQPPPGYHYPPPQQQQPMFYPPNQGYPPPQQPAGTGTPGRNQVQYQRQMQQQYYAQPAPGYNYPPPQQPPQGSYYAQPINQYPQQNGYPQQPYYGGPPQGSPYYR